MANTLTRIGALSRATSIDAMPFAVVLFDLDGTVVDSGGIILASMRHATREVLGREFADAELMAAVGGPGLEAQMRELGPEHVDELVRVYRAHNEPLHEELASFAGIDDVLVRLKDDGRRLGIVSAKRRSTVALAFARVEVGHLFDVVVGGDDTERQKPAPDPLLHALALQAAKAAGLYAVGVTWGRIHDREALHDADVLVDSPEELLAVL
jgi:pyrophosphatase PpaX